MYRMLPLLLEQNKIEERNQFAQVFSNLPFADPHILAIIAIRCNGEPKKIKQRELFKTVVNAKAVVLNQSCTLDLSSNSLKI